jgi:hypothetical protein
MQKAAEDATDDQLELLSAAEEVSIDDLLEEVLTQGEVVQRLRDHLGQTIPDSVLQRRQDARQERSRAKECRICGRTGDSTQHHYINRWILKQLDGYQHRWASRTYSCIPVCINCHRDLHSRQKGAHSIVPFLTDEEKDFAERAIQALYDEKPRLWLLIARGDEDVYETKLMHDWLMNRFKVR